MPQSTCFLFKNSLEFWSRNAVDDVPPLVRGIYVLYEERDGKHMDVVYVGMARGQNSGAKARLRSHLKSKAEWTHFSVFEVWDNITKEQVQELEGLFRHLYRSDTRANKLNVQKSYKPLASIRRKTVETWLG